MKDLLLRLLIDEDGPTAVEYAVMLALIIVVAVVSIGLLGTELNNSLEDSNTQMANAFS
ncbi:MAG: Flp family type IVb pilin [Planctomycetes bacterium]|nr:Flp family type IVb pilin [Planctomycetota bacterium]